MRRKANAKPAESRGSVNNDCLCLETELARIGYDIKCATCRARKAKMDAIDRLEELRELACSIRAVTYGGDKIQTSNTYDLSDVAVKIEEAGWEVYIASLRYIGAMSVMCNCIQIMRESFKIGAEDAKIWKLYFCDGLSMGEIAKRLGTTKSHVQHVLSGKANRFYFERAVMGIMEAIEP